MYYIKSLTINFRKCVPIPVHHVNIKHILLVEHVVEHVDLLQQLHQPVSLPHRLWLRSRTTSSAKALLDIVFDKSIKIRQCTVNFPNPFFTSAVSGVLQIFLKYHSNISQIFLKYHQNILQIFPAQFPVGRHPSDISIILRCSRQCCLYLPTFQVWVVVMVWANLKFWDIIFKLGEIIFKLW